MRDAGHRTPDAGHRTSYNGHRTAKKAKIIYPPPRGVDIMRLLVLIKDSKYADWENIMALNVMGYYI